VSFLKKIIQIIKQEYPELDSPEPVTYKQPAHIVWARVEEALHTIPVTQKGVSCQTNLSNPTPLGSDPTFLQATFTFHHADFESLRHLLPPEHKDLRSSLIMQAYVKPKGNKSELTLRWKSAAIMSNRTRHNQFIRLMTQAIDTLIKDGTQIAS
jgi:hypothetical protein